MDNESRIPPLAPLPPLPPITDEITNYYIVQELIRRYFDTGAMHMIGDMIRFEYKSTPVEITAIKREFMKLGYMAHFGGKGDRKTCILVPAVGPSAKARKREKRIALLLFVITLLTTTSAGYAFAQQSGGNVWLGALSFSLSLLLILGSHEMSHKWASRRYGIDSTPPFFIPIPSLLPFVDGLISFGTMGAVIRVKSPMPDRNASVALGFSGPIAGFVLALPIMIAGLLMSDIVPIPPGQSLTFGDSLLIIILSKILLNLPHGYTINANPLVISSWIGIFVTGLNLIPVGQLDGGHVAYAVLGQKKFKILCWTLVGILLVMGIFLWQGWLLWAVIGAFLTRRGQPKTLNDARPLTRSSYIMAAAALILFILTFMPVPLIIK